jgi:hypothetical protein
MAETTPNGMTSPDITIEEQLQELRAQILYARKKAESYRRRAETQDRLADEKVKLAAALGTPELPTVTNPIPEGRIYPDLARKI